MRPVDINLAGKPFRNDAPLTTGLALLAALALGFSAFNAWAWYTVDARKREVSAELAGHRARMETIRARAAGIQGGLGKVDLDILESQANFVSSILGERNFSWTLLFNSLERVQPWDVRLISVRPMFDNGRVVVQLRGTARSFEGYLALQDALQNAPEFGDAQPNGYERGQDERTTFTIETTYHPDKVPESARKPAPRDGEGEGDVESGDAGDDGGQASAPPPPRLQGAGGANATRPSAPAGMPAEAPAVRRPDAQRAERGRPGGPGGAPGAQPPGAQPPGARRGAKGGDMGNDFPDEPAGAFGVPGGRAPGGASAPTTGRGGASSLPGGANRVNRSTPEDPATRQDEQQPAKPGVDRRQVETGDENGTPVFRPWRKETPPATPPGDGGSGGGK